uniref:Uncharacterized protein n=1 Tax=Anguilla anguilla TaxID=7936 RepID=A0A0E9V3D1_ANGAN
MLLTSNTPKTPPFRGLQAFCEWTPKKKVPDTSLPLTCPQAHLYL